MEGLTSDGKFLSDAKQRPTGLIAETLAFMRHHRKWWLLPVILTVLLLGLLVFLGGTAAAPFIYTLF